MQATISTTLKDEFQYYLDNQAEIAAKYDGMVIVLKAHKVIGSYRTQLEALTDAKKEHPMCTFLVQQVSKDASGYSHTFHSRVAFQ
jgi:hypothetical protein